MSEVSRFVILLDESSDNVGKNFFRRLRSLNFFVADREVVPVKCMGVAGEAHRGAMGGLLDMCFYLLCT